MDARIPTGIRIIDDMLGGGFERGSSILLRSSPFVDSVPVGQEWLFNRLRRGDKCIYFINNKPPDIFLDEMESYGWPARPYRERGDLQFIDAYSGVLGIESSEAFRVEDTQNVQEINEVVLNALKKKRGALIFFDSLNTLIDQCGKEVLSHVYEWCRYGLTYDISTVYLYTEWGYPREITSKIERTFDTIIDLKALKRIVASEVLTVTKIGSKPVEDKKILPIRYVKPGGLRVYVPKILVTGPYHAGKTTIVHALSSGAVSVQRMGTTVALDFGHADRKGFSVDLFGTVGQPRFDPMLDTLGGEALGVMLVVDSTKPGEFPRAVEMMKKAGGSRASLCCLG